MKIEPALKKTLGFGSKEFNEKAIAGGWVPKGLKPFPLDPLAWQAVGKTEGWLPKGYRRGSAVTVQEEWFLNMHRFVDLLKEEREPWSCPGNICDGSGWVAKSVLDTDTHTYVADGEEPCLCNPLGLDPEELQP